jgi:hypothetical protein
MEDIFNKYDTDKNSHFHNYPRQYSTLFEKYRTKNNLKFLEIGVFRGGSIKAWREYFTGTDTVVVGVDLNPVEGVDGIEIGDATDPIVVQRLHDKYGPFDVIVDDGGHRNDQVIQSFELLFPLLADDGLYVVEDTVIWNDASFLNPMYPSHLQYFCQFTQFLNQHRKDDYCVDPFKNFEKETENVFEYSLDKMEFGVSYIALHKLVREHWKSKPFKLTQPLS